RGEIAEILKTRKSRYFYKVWNITEKEDVRSKFVSRALNVDDDEEELSWDVEDEEEDGNVVREDDKKPSSDCEREDDKKPSSDYERENDNKPSLDYERENVSSDERKLSVVMSFASSTITYTSVYTDSEPGRVFWGDDEEISDGVPKDEDKREPMFIQPPDPDYVPEPMYPEYIPLEDEHVFLVEENPLPPVVLPTAESLGYVVKSDPEEDPEEYKDDETEDGLVDYPIERGEDGDDDDGNSSRDDANDEDEDEEDEDKEDKEEEEEHLAPANSAVVVPTVELVSP
ncbi:hypothetical protein Tco_0811686, partial [Tanacetum coccineum]